MGFDVMGFDVMGFDVMDFDVLGFQSPQFAFSAGLMQSLGHESPWNAYILDASEICHHWGTIIIIMIM